MTFDRIKLCAVAAAIATSLTGQVYGQSTGGAAGTSPAPAGAPALSSGAAVGQSGIAAPAPGPGGAALTQPAPSPDATRNRADPTRAQNPSPASTQQPQSPASTQPSAARGLATGAAAQGTAQPAPTDAAATGSGVTGGVPAMNGITPSRAELPGSAFTKLDAANRGYLTLEDVRQLDGFQSAFRQADQNGDGRLNASEFNSAWGVYSGNVR